MFNPFKNFDIRINVIIISFLNTRNKDTSAPILNDLKADLHYPFKEFFNPQSSSKLVQLYD